MLFSERSIWTMVHGIGLGGGALIGLAAALFYLYAARSSWRARVRRGCTRLPWRAKSICRGSPRC